MPFSSLLFSSLLFSSLLFSSLLFSPPSHAAVSTDSLVGYWKFDETSGTSAADSAGDGNTGTHTNSPTISTDVPSMISFTNARSLSFDGVDDYVDLGSAASLKATSAFSVSAWIKHTSTSTYDPIVTRIGAGGEDNYNLYNNAGTLTFGIRESGCNATTGVGTWRTLTSSLTDTSTWHHVIGTYDGSNSRLYVDGSSVATSGVTFSVCTTPIGRTDVGAAGLGIGGASFNGLIDDVRIYNRALSATEITALANGTHTSATWDGDTSTNFETAGNWDTGVITDPYTNITIPNAGAAPVCTANIQAASLTINSSASLDLSSFNLTLNDSGAFTNNGTLLLNGTQTLSNFTNDTDTGTEIINGSTNLTGFPTGTTYNNLRIEDPTENGLVGYWKLDEGGGTSAADLSGNSNTGTLTNGPSYSTDVNTTTTYPNGRSLSFDGTNDYVQVADSASVSTTSDISVSAWVKRNGTGNGDFIATRWTNTSNQRSWQFYIDGSTDRSGLSISPDGIIDTQGVNSSNTIGTS